jgi:tetratricopeptide (TPR) repeat protein
VSIPVPEFESLTQFVNWWGSPDVQQSIKEDAGKLAQLAEDPRIRLWLDEFLKALQSVRPHYSGKPEDTMAMLTTASAQYDELVREAVQSWQMKTTWDIGEQTQQEVLHTFSRYRNLRKLGEGGFGTVYRAYDPELERTVALKLFKFRTQTELEEFKREAKLAARLQHPSIVSVHEFGIIDSQPYYTMDFFEGKSLADLLDKKGELPVEEAFRIGITIADALSYAHENGILHRDVKPANVFIDKEGRAYIGDFGVAKQVEVAGGQATTSRIVGTPYYMSPEQTDCRPLDGRSDIWAIGVVLYKMLTGTYPFQGNTASDLFTKIWLNEPTPPRKHNPEVDRDTETIVLKCLEKDPARRFESAAALRDDMQRRLKGEPIKARPIGAPEKLWRRIKRHKTASVSIAVALIALIVIVAVLWHQSAAREEELEARNARAARLFKDAKQAFKDREYEIALGLVSETLALTPGNKEGQKLKALCDGKIKEKRRREEARKRAEEIIKELPMAATLDKKLQILRDAIAADPTWLSPRVKKGEFLKDAGRHVEALKAFDEAIEIAISGGDTNGEAACFFYKAMIYWQREEYQKALPFFSKVLQLMPGVRNPKTLYAQAAGAYFKRRYKEAANLLEEALRLDSKFADAYNSRGMILYAQGKLKEAIADYMRAIKLKPHFWFYDNCGVARRDKGDLDGAIDDFFKAIELNPKDPRVYINRGIAYHIKSELDKAIADFSKACELAKAAGDNKTTAGALTNRGNVHYDKGKYKDAIAGHSKAVLLNPSFAAAYCNRARAKMKIGDIKGAIADYDKAIRIAPKDVQALNSRAYAKLKNDDCGGAIADCLEALGINSKFWPAWASLSLAYSGKRDREHCLDAIRNLLNLNKQMQGWVRTYPGFAWLHDDPEFKRILKD